MLLLTISGCKKDNTLYEVFFYTNLEGEKGQLDFYLNDVYRGKLPFVARDAADFPDSLLYKTFKLELTPGTCTIKAFDANNELKVSSTLSFSKTRTSNSGSMGGNSMSVKSNTMVVNLFY